MNPELKPCAYCDVTNTNPLQHWEACESAGRCWHRFENALMNQECALYAGIAERAARRERAEAWAAAIMVCAFVIGVVAMAILL